MHYRLLAIGKRNLTPAEDLETGLNRRVGRARAYHLFVPARVDVQTYGRYARQNRFEGNRRTINNNIAGNPRTYREEP
jgi:hypothetical protein